MTLLANDAEILEFLAQQHERDAKLVKDQRGYKRIAEALRRSADHMHSLYESGNQKTIEFIAEIPRVGDRITDGDDVWVVMADFDLDIKHVRVWRKSDGHEQIMSAAEWSKFCQGKRLA
jgi:hypothetical protein